MNVRMNDWTKLLIDNEDDVDKSKVEKTIQQRGNKLAHGLPVTDKLERPTDCQVGGMTNELTK